MTLLWLSEAFPLADLPSGLFLLSGQYMMEGQGTIDTGTCAPLGHTLLPSVVSWPVSLTSVMPDASELNKGVSPHPPPHSVSACLHTGSPASIRAGATGRVPHPGSHGHYGG